MSSLVESLPEKVMETKLGDDDDFCICCVPCCCLMSFFCECMMALSDACAQCVMCEDDDDL